MNTYVFAIYSKGRKLNSAKAIKELIASGQDCDLEATAFNQRDYISFLDILKRGEKRILIRFGKNLEKINQFDLTKFGENIKP